MKLSILAGTTSKLLDIFIQDSSSVVGAGLTGLVYNSAGMTAYYYREGAASATSMTLVTMTLGTWTSLGFIVIDGTNMPGCYQLGIPDAAVAAGAKSVLVMLKSATNMAPLVLEIELTAVNNQSATAFVTSVALAAGQLFIKKNTQITISFPMTDSTNHLPLAGLTVTATRSIDGAAVGACANGPTGISAGLYSLVLAAADVNGSMISLILSSAGADTRFIGLVTQP